MRRKNYVAVLAMAAMLAASGCGQKEASVVSGETETFMEDGTEKVPEETEEMTEAMTEKMPEETETAEITEVISETEESIAGKKPDGQASGSVNVEKTKKNVSVDYADSDRKENNPAEKKDTTDGNTDTDKNSNTNRNNTNVGTETNNAGTTDKNGTNENGTNGSGNENSSANAAQKPEPAPEPKPEVNTAVPAPEPKPEVNTAVPEPLPTPVPEEKPDTSIIDSNKELSNSGTIIPADRAEWFIENGILENGGTLNEDGSVTMP